jgi:tetratricopeptide (TPR) repeat protein
MKIDCPMSWTRAAKIGAQIADAVAAAQAQGIVHRDLKPENVVLQPMADGTEVVKVLDFGLAKYARDSMAPPQVRGAQHVTQLGVVVGTPGYMAPEQAVGMRADHRVDLYALGVMLWECVAGRRLWNSADVQRLLTTQLSSRPPLLRAECGDPSIPDAFELLVAELLATRPENRPQSAAETRDRLRALVETEQRELHARSEMPRLELPAIAPPPPDTDTVFVNAAVMGWRAGALPRAADATAGANEPQLKTDVFVPGAVDEAVGQPATIVGFRPARMALGDAAPEARESSQPQAAPAPVVESVPALQSAAELAEIIAVKPRASLRLYVALAALALAVLSFALWAAHAPDSPSSFSSAPARAHSSRPSAEHGAASSLDATGAVPAQSPTVSGPAATAPHALPALSSAQPAATHALAETAPGLRSPASTKHDGLGAVARVSREPEFANALRAKARAQFRNAEFELSAETYRLAIKTAPGYSGAYAGLGASQLALGDARGAIASYEQAIRRSPGTSGFHAALGRACLMIPDRARAVAEYRKAVALDPANEVASRALARLTL